MHYEVFEQVNVPFKEKNLLNFYFADRPFATLRVTK